jgi:phenylacetate-CoA ligase
MRLGAAYEGFQKSAGMTDEHAVAAMARSEVERMVRHARKHCPWYEKTWEKVPRGALPGSLDWEQAPLLTKGDLQRHRDELTSRAFPPSARLLVTTGGSTGEPVGFYLHKGISRAKEQAFLEAIWSRRDYQKGDRLVVIRGHVTTPQAEGRIDFYDAARDWLMLSSYHMTEERLPEYLERIERFRPVFLHAYPSALLILAEYLDRHRQSWRLPLKGLLCGSEQLTLPQKRMLERIFGCRAIRWYGHSERVVLAAEGATSDLYYFFPTYGFVEFGPEDEDGRREVIGTSFHRLVMPLIRYRTGDYVRLAPPAPEARREFPEPWAAASEIAGREQEFLVTGNGRRISLTAINMHDDTFAGLYAVQFIQERRGEAEVRYVPSPAFHTSRLEEIQRRLQTKLGPDFTIRFRHVAATEKTARGKHRWLVSDLLHP